MNGEIEIPSLTAPSSLMVRSWGGKETERRAESSVGVLDFLLPFVFVFFFFFSFVVVSPASLLLLAFHLSAPSPLPLCLNPMIQCLISGYTPAYACVFPSSSWRCVSMCCLYPSIIRICVSESAPLSFSPSDTEHLSWEENFCFQALIENGTKGCANKNASWSRGTPELKITERQIDEWVTWGKRRRNKDEWPSIDVWKPYECQHRSIAGWQRDGTEADASQVWRVRGCHMETQQMRSLFGFVTRSKYPLPSSAFAFTNLLICLHVFFTIS